MKCFFLLLFCYLISLNVSTQVSNCAIEEYAHETNLILLFVFLITVTRPVNNHHFIILLYIQIQTER